jgi:predicted MFS family arabinose efflux permease
MASDPKMDASAEGSLFSVLANRTYRHLFLAQVVALIGTGLATVAVGLLAYDLAGKDGGAVLGMALAIKMIAYVVVAPIAGAYANRVPRRTLLVALDLARLGAVVAMPFVSEIWQIFALIVILQSCSAAFTPTFQATIPEVLPEERDYTKALSLSRLAYDLETLLSPALAALLLLVLSYHALFIGTALGFLASALLVVSVLLPRGALPAAHATVREKLTRGIRIYLLTPRLRGLLALNLAAAAGSAMVIVNTAVIVRNELGLSDRAVAVALAAFGAGSMAMAFALPRILRSRSDRMVMMSAGVALTLLLAVQGAIWSSLPMSIRWPMLLAAWFGLGAAYAALVTPGGRLLRRSSHEDDRPALFAAQFSLSHACWLIAYPAVGLLGARVGTAQALLGMTALAAIGLVIAAVTWPRHDEQVLTHRHDDLPPHHPHMRGTAKLNEHEHAHAYVIDDLHVRWPA